MLAWPIPALCQADYWAKVWRNIGISRAGEPKAIGPGFPEVFRKFLVSLSGGPRVHVGQNPRAPAMSCTFRKSGNSRFSLISTLPSAAPISAQAQARQQDSATKKLQLEPFVCAHLAPFIGAQSSPHHPAVGSRGPLTQPRSRVDSHAIVGSFSRAFSRLCPPAPRAGRLWGLYSCAQWHLLYACDLYACDV